MEFSVGLLQNGFFHSLWDFCLQLFFIWTAWFFCPMLCVKLIISFWPTQQPSSPAALQPTTDYCKDTAQICFVFMNALEWQKRITLCKQVDEQEVRSSMEVSPDMQDGLVGALARALASRRPAVESGEMNRNTREDMFSSAIAAGSGAMDACRFC